MGSFVQLDLVKPFDEYFKPLIKVILQCVLDEHELVQSAACWALSTIQVSSIIFNNFNRLLVLIIVIFSEEGVGGCLSILGPNS